MKSSTQTGAKIVGKTLAHVQHAFDRVTAWGFKQMRTVGEQKEEVVDPAENIYAHRAKKIGRNVFGFLGTAGDTFYKEYENLKKKSSKAKRSGSKES